MKKFFVFAAFVMAVSSCAPVAVVDSSPKKPPLGSQSAKRYAPSQQNRGPFRY